MFNYMWSQRPNYCQESCPYGDYTYPAGWRGEYIDENAVDTATGAGDRTCHLCNERCRWCRHSADECLECRGTNVLMDLHTECMARYIDPNNCSVCTANNACGASTTTADRKCVANCPPYFYFKLFRTYAATHMYSVNNSRYNNYTNILVANETIINGTDNAATVTLDYRRGTNLCMLCDFRCIVCTGPLNTMCT